MTALIYRRAEIGRILIVSQGFYYCFYILISGLMIWINHFDLLRGTLGTLLIEVAVICVLCFFQSAIFRNSKILRRLKLYREESLRFTLSWKKYLPLAIILAVSAFLVHEKAGFYGTGQDQGLYQIRAMMYMGGYNDNIIDFPEYYYVENNWEKSEYLRILEDMDGYYLLKKDGLENANEVNGVLHGIATFSAMLGLWGKMFGLCNMPGIMTVLYLLTLANVWLIGDNLGFKPWVKWILTSFMAVCPIIVWSSQQTLTEMGFTLMVCAFLELMTENTKKKVYFWSVIPLLAACYYHVIFTVLIPLFVILYLTNYLQSKRRGFLAALMLLMIGYATGYSMMQSTAFHYTMKNFQQLFSKSKNLLNENNIEAVIWIASAIVFAVAVVLVQKEVRRVLFPWWSRVRESFSVKKTIGWVLRVVTMLLILFFVYKGVKAYRMDMWPMKLSVMGYLIMTGYVMVPAMVFGIWLKAGNALRDRNVMTLVLSCFYVMLFYCGVLWVLIYYYYYYARYLSPFVVLILIIGGYFLNRIPWQIAVPVCLCMITLVKSQSSLLYNAQDLTYISYEQLEEIAALIGDQRVDSEDDPMVQKDVILIYDQGYRSPRIFALALKGLTGADVLYLNYDRLSVQLMECRARYEDIYVVQYNLGRFKPEDENWTFLYWGVMKTSLYDNFVESGLPYAKEAVTLKTPLSLLIYNQ
ncbi:MAG: hypothetical protein K2J95_09565 [Lachnospiraceae bacterium]|nr:hypothetical protein [Lachnospiraceae bacterium]